MATPTFTRLDQGAPPADRFRPGDAWLGPDGRRYRAQPDPTAGVAWLRPIGPAGPSVMRRRGDVRGWRRATWGGAR